MESAPILELRVTRAEPAAHGIQLFELRDPAGARLPGFEPGAHIAIDLPGGPTRTYSLCNDPAETDRYVIAVKRDTAGRGGSVRLVDEVQAGHTLRVQAPRNQFALVPAPAYVFVAGGIGITPILSMIRHLVATGGPPFHLYYLTRTPTMAAFLQELSDPAIAPHVTLHHDEGDPDLAFDLWPVFETPSRAHMYCCGPRPLMTAVRDMTGHWPSSALHFEDFGTGLAAPRAEDVPFPVRLARSGAMFEVAVGTTILEAMRAHGATVPSSCESGTCGTCRTRVIAGDPDHRDLVLTPAERNFNMMVCVSRARSLLVLDA